jgi:hypothetical protein
LEHVCWAAAKGATGTAANTVIQSHLVFITRQSPDPKIAETLGNIQQFATKVVI